MMRRLPLILCLMLAGLCLFAWASSVSVGVYRGGSRYWCSAGLDNARLCTEVFFHPRMSDGLSEWQVVRDGLPGASSVRPVGWWWSVERNAQYYGAASVHLGIVAAVFGLLSFWLWRRQRPRSGGKGFEVSPPGWARRAH